MSAEQLIQCHAMYAEYLNQPVIRDICADAVATLVITQWSAFTRRHWMANPSDRIFDVIENAIAFGERGWAMTRLVLVAASNIDELGIDDQSRVKIEDIAI